MTYEVDEEATNTMIMLDTEVRKKIRQELIGMVLNPQSDVERTLVSDIVNAAHRVHQREQMRREMARANEPYRNTPVVPNRISISDYVNQSLSKIGWK